MLRKFGVIAFMSIGIFLFASCKSDKSKENHSIQTTAEEQYNAALENLPQEELQDLFTLFVASELADCVGVAPQKCMQVKQSEDAPWEMMYSSIEGFTYEPGYEYKLEVRSEQVENAPMDASSLRIILVNQISKEKK
ncbi:DUF4377 domain-containing protein [Myroides sp. LJL116]